MKRSPWALWGLCMVGISVVGCSTAFGRAAATDAAKYAVSDANEQKLGEQVHQELAKQGTKYVNDPLVNSYVAGVANRVLSQAKKDRPGVTWRTYVIDDPKTVNAFAVPGGSLYVYTGLLLAADNEAELAGVWGHEAGHVVARHSAQQLVSAYGLEAVTSLAFGKNPGLLSKLGSQLVGKGAMLAYSRGNETEADEFGARYAAAAGYDPHGIVQFFEKLGKSEGKSSRAMLFLSDHPLTADRVDAINRYISAKRLRGRDLGADRLASIKARLGNQTPLTPKSSSDR